jgi:peptidoglycan/LPS O-acetylase OafA/YrhL
MVNVKNRIEYLDGHRGLAILFVIFFHAYARWPELVPYDGRYANIFIFKYGGLGVELFFLISGFVILMTLEKCDSAGEFLYRRWLRLFPAMAICSGIIFLTSDYFHERPAGHPSWQSLLPGLTFIEPDWWMTILGHPINQLEGAFWSLYVEFKFYIFSALIYYWRGRNALIGSLLFAFFAAALFKVAEKVLGMSNLLAFDSILRGLSFKYFGWFAAGAAFYVFSQNKSRKWFALAIGSALISAVIEGGFDRQRLLAAMLVALFFAASTIVEPIRNILSLKFIQFFGAISYPLYLIHENMMISIIIKFSSIFEVIPKSLIPIPVIAMLSVVAFLIFLYIEPRVLTGLQFMLRDSRKKAH